MFFSELSTSVCSKCLAEDDGSVRTVSATVTWTLTLQDGFLQTGRSELGVDPIQSPRPLTGGSAATSAALRPEGPRW